MRNLITIAFLTILVWVATYWLTIGLLNIADWAGHELFANIMAGWSVFQFLFVALLGESKTNRRSIY